MNGFRIWTAADNRFLLHTNWRKHTAAKTPPRLLAGLSLLLLMNGCGNKTPTYEGPPDTVRQIVMKKWEIVPSRVEVPQGARVELVVTSTDVEHGIDVFAGAYNDCVRKALLVREEAVERSDLGA